MHKVSKRIGVVALAACLFAALAAGSMLAWGSVSWQSAGGENSLTVNATNNEEQAEDIAKANVVVDVYQVATAEKDASYDTYNYTWASPFGEGAMDISGYTASSWQELAGKLATEDNLKAASLQEAAGKEIGAIENGLYLVVPHGKDMAPTFENGAAVLKAQSDTREYTFSPTLVALPSKLPKTDADGSVITEGDSGLPVIGTAADYGEWQNAVTIALKPADAPLYGSLRVNKTVVGENADATVEPATFVFRIVSTDDSPYKVDKRASVYYTGGGSASTVVTHIPAGAVVTVDEVYAGARYGKVSGDGSTATIVADAEGQEIASVSFTNRAKTTIPGGNGIENNFELTKKSDDPNDWDWVLTVTPESAQVSE